MSLTTLPLLVLEEIASKLDFSSLVNLATSTKDLVHLQPKEQQVFGEDFSIHQEYSDGHFCPKTYFDVEVITRGLGVEGPGLGQPEGAGVAAAGEEQPGAGGQSRGVLRPRPAHHAEEGGAD